MGRKGQRKKENCELLDYFKFLVLYFPGFVAYIQISLNAPLGKSAQECCGGVVTINTYCARLNKIFSDSCTNEEGRNLIYPLLCNW